MLTTITLTDALQAWISEAPTHHRDLVALHTRPGDSPAEHAATHAVALANAGHVLRLTDVTMTHDEVLAFTTCVNDTETGKASGDRAPFYPLGMYYPPVEGLFAAETPIPGNGHLATLNPDTNGLYRLDVLGTVLAPALSPEVRLFASERLNAIDYFGILHLAEIVSRHVATWGSWVDAADAIQHEITDVTRRAGEDPEPDTAAAHIAHAIDCVGPVDDWFCDAENFWGVNTDVPGAPRDVYYGETVPVDWPTLTSAEPRTGALFYLANIPAYVRTDA